MLKYKGISLHKYCKENNLNYYTVRDRINKQKLSIDAAVKIKITKSKLYDGKSLRKWCLEKGYDYKKIYSRMYYKNLTPEEAINFPEKVKYKIDNEPLISYMKNKGYSQTQYRNLLYKINREHCTAKEAYEKWIERKLSKKLKK